MPNKYDKELAAAGSLPDIGRLGEILEAFTEAHNVVIVTARLSKEGLNRLEALLIEHEAGTPVARKIINNYALPGGAIS